MIFLQAELYVRLFRFVFMRMDGFGKVIFIRELEQAMEIRKSPDVRGIADSKAGKDCMEIVFFKVSGPFGIGRDLEFHGK